MDFWNGAYIKYSSGDNIGLHRLVTDFDSGTDTLTHDAFPDPVSAGDEYFLTDWKRQESPTLTATLSVLLKDIFNINATSGSGSVYWEKDITNLSTSTYTKILIRYKTSDTNIKAKVELVFADASTQMVLVETSSVAWAILKATPTPAKTVDKIRFYATSATGDVYYELFLIYEDDFEFPAVTDVLTLKVPNIYVDIRGIGRAGNTTQYLGRDSMPIIITGVMNDAAGWGSPTGDTLLQLWHEAGWDAFQWLESDNYKGKVTLRDFNLDEPSRDKEMPRGYEAILKEFSRSNLGETTWLYGWKGY